MSYVIADNDNEIYDDYGFTNTGVATTRYLDDQYCPSTCACKVFNFGPQTLCPEDDGYTNCICKGPNNLQIISNKIMHCIYPNASLNYATRKCVYDGINYLCSENGKFNHRIVSVLMLHLIWIHLKYLVIAYDQMAQMIHLVDVVIMLHHIDVL